MIKKFSPILLSCLLIFIFELKAADQPQKSSSGSEVKHLIDQLGSEEFAKRQEAEENLKSMGAKALPALQKAGNSHEDVQVRTTALRLTRELRWNTFSLKNRWLDIFPDSSIIAGHFLGGKDSLEKFKNTVLGQIIFGEHLAETRKWIEQEVDKNNKLKEALPWVKRFSGSAGGAIWELNPALGEKGIKGAAVVEIVDENPEGVWNQITQEINNRVEAQYKGINIIYNPRGAGSIAFAGKWLILSTTKEIIENLIDKIESKPEGGLGSNQELTALQKDIPFDGELIAIVNAVKYNEMLQNLFKMMPVPGGGKENPIQKIFENAGYDSLKWMVLSSSWTSDGGEDKYAIVTKENPKGIVAESLKVPDGEIEKAIEAIPADSAAASITWLHGKMVTEFTMDYAKSMISMQEETKKVIAQIQGEGAPEPIDPDKLIKTYETKLGVTFSEFGTSLNGPVAIWLSAPPNNLPVPPDVGIFITAVSPEKAKAWASNLAKLLNALEPNKKLVTTQEKEGKTYYQFQPAQLNPNAAMVPYVFGWSNYENRIYFTAASMNAHKSLAEAIDKLTTIEAPGLKANKVFKKATEGLPENALNLGVFFMDSELAAAKAIDIGRGFAPLAAGAAKGQVAQKLLQQLMALPQGNVLFKDLPPVIGYSVKKDETVISTIKGPAPFTPGIFFLSVGASLGTRMLIH